jgi:hypothetical protein
MKPTALKVMLAVFWRGVSQIQYWNIIKERGMKINSA